MPTPTSRRAGRIMGWLLATSLLATGCSDGGADPDQGAAGGGSAAGKVTSPVNGAGQGQPARATGKPTSGAAAPGLEPPPTPDDPATQTVLTAIDTMDSHGPYRIAIASGKTKAFLDVVPPGRTHYYTTKGKTVGEEISVDGAVWVRGPDGHWQSTDGITHHGPSLTVADVLTVEEQAKGSDGAQQYRSFRVTGKDPSGKYQATVSVWVDGSRLRDVRITGSDKITTTYAFEYGQKLTITPPKS